MDNSLLKNDSVRLTSHSLTTSTSVTITCCFLYTLGDNLFIIQDIQYQKANIKAHEGKLIQHCISLVNKRRWLDILFKQIQRI